MRAVVRLLAVSAIAALLCALPVYSQVVANDAYQVNYVGYGRAPVPNDGVVEFQRDQVRIINTGQIGSPIDAATNFGTACADLYVFDANQEMLECCSCPITANGLLTLDVNQQLLNSPLTGVVPTTTFDPVLGSVAGTAVVKVVADRGCDETSITAPVNGALRAAATHGLNSLLFVCDIRTGACSPQVTPRNPNETLFQPAPLTVTEQQFLGQACSFVQYLGSGRGRCICGAVD